MRHERVPLLTQVFKQNT